MDSHHGAEHPGPFLTAVRDSLEFLQRRLGLDLWMFTRTEADDWIVLDVVDRNYGVKPGDVFQWTDSFCSRMVQGLGPSVAPRSGEVPAYVEAPIGKKIPIEAYVGFPVFSEDGSLFGTLCAIDPKPQAETLTDEQPLIDFVSRLLSALLQAELRGVAASRETEQFRQASMLDELTGLANRRGWEQTVEREEERCRRYGSPAAVLIIDLDDLKKTNDLEGHEAGDELIRNAAQALADTVRTQDLVARIGGDEFAALLVEAAEPGGLRVHERLVHAFDRAGIRASIGLADRDPRSTLREAIRLADSRMYENKRQKAA